MYSPSHMCSSEDMHTNSTATSEGIDHHGSSRLPFIFYPLSSFVSHCENQPRNLLHPGEAIVNSDTSSRPLALLPFFLPVRAARSQQPLRQRQRLYNNEATTLVNHHRDLHFSTALAYSARTRHHHISNFSSLLLQACSNKVAFLFNNGVVTAR